MTFESIPIGSEVFLDANTLIYHFANDALYGASCTRLMERIEQGDLRGITSADVVSDAAHRMMTIEAVELLGWPISGIAARLRDHHAEIPRLTLFQQAIEQVPRLGIRVVDVNLDLVLAAAKLSRQHQLLSGDALILAVMHANRLTILASNDRDFDRVPWLTRHTPT